MRIRILAFVVAVSLSTGVLRAQSFTLDQVLSAPFPANVTAAHGAAGRAAWTSLERGARSVWVANLAAGTATRVAHWANDDGQDLGQLEFSRDGSTIAFVRGQGFNNQRENPNPASDPAGTEQAVWVSVRGQLPRRLGAGADPQPSPDGSRVIWQRDSAIMIAPSTGATPARPLFRARGNNQTAQWSPDGRMVAFTSQRGDHSFVGVYELATRAIRWMAPGVDRDAMPRWSPDGKQLAFIRTDGGQGGGNVFAPGAGRGFGLMVGDPRTGAARQIWHSEIGPKGRLRVPTAGEAFLWSGRHLVIFTEADGWQHLYSIAADGSQSAPTQLTTGPCEVEEPSATVDGREIYFSANCEDIDRKHIWKVATAGGTAPTRVTGTGDDATGIQYAPAVSGGRMLFLRADWRRPPAPAVLTLASGRVTTLAGAPALPATFPASALVEPRPVILKAADGTEVHGQLFLPADTAGGRAPGLVFMHGGPVRQMLLGWHPRGYYNRAYGMNQYLASRGYAVLSVNYRGGVGYGRAFREPARLGRQGASEYQDVVAAGKYLQTLAAVDSARIGLWGGSYGGYLTAYGMAKNPELFKAGVDLHGVHDWNARFSNFAPAALGMREADSVVAVGRAASPVCCVDNIRGPILLIQGDDDRNVAFSETVNLVQMLRRANKPFELLIFPDEVHDFLRHQNWLTAYRATEDFFDRTLKRGERVAAQ